MIAVLGSARRQAHIRQARGAALTRPQPRVGRLVAELAVSLVFDGHFPTLFLTYRRAGPGCGSGRGRGFAIAILSAFSLALAIDICSSLSVVMSRLRPAIWVLMSAAKLDACQASAADKDGRTRPCWRWSEIPGLFKRPPCVEPHGDRWTKEEWSRLCSRGGTRAARVRPNQPRQRHVRRVRRQVQTPTPTTHRLRTSLAPRHREPVEVGPNDGRDSPSAFSALSMRP